MIRFFGELFFNKARYSELLLLSLIILERCVSSLKDSIFLINK